MFSVVFSGPEIDLTNMTPEAKKAIVGHRMKQHKMICYFGAAFLMWTDKAALLNMVFKYDHTYAQLCAFYFTFALVSVLLGTIAALFPDTAPWATAVAWNGSLQTFLFLNACFHLKMIDLYPELVLLTISYMVTSLIIIFWFVWVRESKVGCLITFQSLSLYRVSLFDLSVRSAWWELHAISRFLCSQELDV